MGDSSEKQAKDDAAKAAKSKKSGSSDKKKKSLGDLWQGIKAEYRKITWPDRKSTFKQSCVVTVISIVLGLIIAIVDAGARYGVHLLTLISK